MKPIQPLGKLTRLMLVATALLLLPLTIGAVSHVHQPGDSCDANHCFWCVVAMGLAVFGVAVPVLSAVLVSGRHRPELVLGRLLSPHFALPSPRAPPAC